MRLDAAHGGPDPRIAPPQDLAMNRLRPFFLLPVAALMLPGLTSPDLAQAQEPPRTVQPGAPGEGTRILTAADMDFTFPPHVEADVHFMQMMIAHHAQALVLSDMVPDRTAREDVKLLAHRIHLSQFDEIRLMAQWLHDRGEDVPDEAFAMGFRPAGHGEPADHAGHAGHTAPAAHDAHAGHAGHGAHAAPADPHAGHAVDAHDHASMPGMLSEEQLAQLAALQGEAFDRLFLEFMIFHHEGAIIMVRELFNSDAGGQEGEMYQFASHVDSDQRIEIERMLGMLAIYGS
jgi:uncharacterized protein (DUF305 family)